VGDCRAISDNLRQGAHVGADRGRGRGAEQQDQVRRHQRAAADAGHADEQTDEKARDDIRASII
jgi:hypothetical protein